MDLKLKGKRALITGSNSGIGAGIARILAAEGVAVVVHGRNSDRAHAVAAEIRAAGGQCAVVLGDVANDTDAKAIAEGAIAAVGGIDILVNNAGGRADGTENQAWFDVDTAAWIGTYQMNTVAAVRLVHHLAPGMKERGWGRIIQISSADAATPYPSVGPDYGASKAAMMNLSLSLSKYLANTGVTVNTVSPGMIYTPLLDGWFADIGQQQGWGNDRAKIESFVLREYVQQTVGRIGRVEDIGTAVAYLASPLADFINGANLRVDGGCSPSIN